jgi:hypothetical protein
MKPTARLHKILAKDESYQIGGLRLPSDDFTASDQEEEVAHFPGCQPIMENTARTIPVRTPTEEDWLVASKAVDSDKIKWAIEGFGSFKSTGEDDTFPALLKNGIEILNLQGLSCSGICTGGVAKGFFYSKARAHIV